MKKIMLSAVAAVIAVAMHGQTVLVEQAREGAARFLQSRVMTGKENKADTAVPLQLAAQVGECCLFNAADGGWVVATVQDGEARVMAYGDSGSIDSESLPENMQAWLAACGEYSLTVPNTTGADEREDIAPMLKTQWGQDAPYNSLCPLVLGEDCVTMVHAVAGCANVALAQLLNYHQWPRSCDEVTYRWLGYPGMEPQDHGTLPATTFDWEAMAEEDEAGRNEVAKLLQYVGYANSTIYRWDASTTYAQRINNTLTAFGYDVTQAEFGAFDNVPFSDAAIYQELAAKRPALLVIEAIDNNDAHVCVIDGYRNDGFYHINWGWEGQGDGYFLLPTSRIVTENISTRFFVQLMITAKIKNDYANISGTRLRDFTNGSSLFDLQGRRLATQPRRGLYIKDGRKMVVK